MRRRRRRKDVEPKRTLEALLVEGKLGAACKTARDYAAARFDELWKLFNRLIEEGQEVLACFIAYASGSAKLVGRLGKINETACSLARTAFERVVNGEIGDARRILGIPVAA